MILALRIPTTQMTLQGRRKLQTQKAVDLEARRSYRSSKINYQMESLHFIANLRLQVRMPASTHLDEHVNGQVQDFKLPEARQPVES